jgi:hypothetical protein
VKNNLLLEWFMSSTILCISAPKNIDRCWPGAEMLGASNLHFSPCYRCRFTITWCLTNHQDSEEKWWPTFVKTRGVSQTAEPPPTSIFQKNYKLSPLMMPNLFEIFEPSPIVKWSSRAAVDNCEVFKVSHPSPPRQKIDISFFFEFLICRIVF